MSQVIGEVIKPDKPDTKVQGYKLYCENCGLLIEIVNEPKTVMRDGEPVIEDGLAQAMIGANNHEKINKGHIAHITPQVFGRN